MKLKHLFLALILFPFSGFAQTSKPELIRQINKDIWAPFTEGVSTNNHALYNGVHSPEFQWVAAGNRTRIMNLKEYIDDSRMVMDGRAGKGIKTKLEIRFLERNLNQDFASEKLVIRYTSTEPGREPVSSYGIAQVFSRRENGVWKKWIQYVHNEPVTAQVYENAQAMQPE